MAEELAEEECRDSSPPLRDELGHYLPGQSGNSSGRPRGKYSLTDALKKQLEEPVDPSNPNGETVADVFAARMISDGLAGNVHAQIAVAERIEGKPAQAVSLSLDGSNPLHHQLGVRTSGARRSAATDAATRLPEAPESTDQHAQGYVDAEYAELPPEPSAT